MFAGEDGGGIYSCCQLLNYSVMQLQIVKILFKSQCTSEMKEYVNLPVISKTTLSLRFKGKFTYTLFFRHVGNEILMIQQLFLFFPLAKKELK